MRKLKIRSETLRVMSSAELTLVVAGIETRTTGTPDQCPPASVGAPSCTGCTSINVACTPNPTHTCNGCTLITF